MDYLILALLFLASMGAMVLGILYAVLNFLPLHVDPAPFVYAVIGLWVAGALFNVYRGGENDSASD